MWIRTTIGDVEWSRGKPEELIETIQQKIKDLYEQGQIMQEIHIDGRVFREDFEEYIVHEPEIGRIEEVVIVSVPEEILMQDIRSNLTEYLPKLLRALDSISELFYGQMSSEDWTHFTQLVDGIHWFTGAVQALRHHLERQGQPSLMMDALVRFEGEAQKLAAELNEALEQQEYTAVGDVLKYEWPELLEPLQAIFDDGGKA